METKKYSRRPFDVDAIRVTKTNMDEVAEWCKGSVVETPATQTTRADRFIQVDVSAPANERQSRAFVGDYVLLLEGGQSFKVYTTKAFNKNFVLAENQDATVKPTPATKKTTKKRPPRKQEEERTGNGIKPEAKEALRKMGQGMKKAAESGQEKGSKVTESFKEAADKVQETVTPTPSPVIEGKDETSTGVETNFYVDPATQEVKERKPAPTGKDETPSAPVELPPNEPQLTNEEKAERAQTNRQAELQVVDRPVENTTEPKLEVTEETPDVKPDGTKRKFIQVD